ncbi:STAS domain-containing protein [Streptomyces sp. NPDC055189]
MIASVYALCAAPADGESSDDTLVVKVTGEIDTTNADAFAAEVGELPGPRPLVLDLSNVLYLDSAGFAVLDRLISRQTVRIVISPGSRTHTAATLLSIPHYAAVDLAVAAAEHRA